MLISIILSFRNEEEAIPGLAGRLHKALKPLGAEYELIFIDDASTDGSGLILREMQKTDRTIKVIRMSRRFGAAMCALAGMEMSKGDAVVCMDAGEKDPPELIPALVEEWKKGADVVYTAPKKRIGSNSRRMIITRLAHRALGFFTDMEMPVDAGGFKLLDRRVVDEIERLREKDPFIRGLVSWAGFSRSRVYSDCGQRSAGVTHYPLFGPGPLKAFMSGLASFSTAPLSLALVAGFMVSFGALLYLAAVIVMRFSGMAPPLWPSVMAAMLFLGGVQLFTVGILGIYISRIYGENRQCSNYVIESTSGFDDNAFGRRPAAGKARA